MRLKGNEEHANNQQMQRATTSHYKFTENIHTHTHTHTLNNIFSTFSTRTLISRPRPEPDSHSRDSFYCILTPQDESIIQMNNSLIKSWILLQNANVCRSDYYYNIEFIKSRPTVRQLAEISGWRGGCTVGMLIHVVVGHKCYTATTWRVQQLQ